MLFGRVYADNPAFERKLLADEYNTWMFFIQVGLIDEFPKLYDSMGQSTLHKISESLCEDRQFLSKLCLMTWVESIKRTENYKPQSANFSSTLDEFSKKGLVNERLDPDFVFKTLIKPVKEDVDAEVKLLKDVFNLVRAGDIKTAQTLLIQSEQPWRALSISGLVPYFDFKINEYPEYYCIPSFFNTIDLDIDSVEDKNPKAFDFDLGNTNIELYVSSC